MGDTGDGSSGAARRAQNEANTKNRGLLRRLIRTLTPPDTGPDTGTPPAKARPATRDDPPGMGNLRRMRVEDVMVPSAEIIAVPLDISRDDLVDVFRTSGLTRLPVYDGTLDTPVGLVHLKDFALSHGFNGKGAAFDLRALLRPLIYVPPSMPIGVLLQKMQNDRIHMALVIDEYGGVDGLVTLEDLVEQVLGEIEDEHDLEEGVMWSRESPACYLAEARAPLDEFEAEIGIPLRGHEPEDDEVDTLGGLAFLLSGRVPARGEVIVHEPTGVEFEVVDADPRRIKRLRVRLPEAGSRTPARAQPDQPGQPDG